jgi:hypothetical protein
VYVERRGRQMRGKTNENNYCIKFKGFIDGKKNFALKELLP